MPWQDDVVPADLAFEVDGKQVAAREHPFFKEAADLPTFFKNAFAAHREVGARIPLKIEKERDGTGQFVPKADSVAKWQQEHLPKLYDNGILVKPPADAKDYEIMAPKPEDLPAGVTWKQEHADAFGKIGIEHGVSKKAMQAFLELHRKAITGTAAELNTDYDKSMLALKEEHKDKFDERMELSKRLTKLIFLTPEDIAFAENTGFGNHPRFLSLLMRLAPYVASDSSLQADLANAGGGGNGNMTGDEVKAELAKIMTDKTHPLYEGYRRNDPEVSKKIDEMYRKVYGSGTVQIGQSVVTPA